MTDSEERNDRPRAGATRSGEDNVTERTSYQVGDRILHAEFGEGLVVEIRDRLFYDILEVVFSCGVKRLTSIHPQIRKAPDPEAEETALPVRKRHAHLGPMVGEAARQLRSGSWSGHPRRLTRPRPGIRPPGCTSTWMSTTRIGSPKLPRLRRAAPR